MEYSARIDSQLIWLQNALSSNTPQQDGLFKVKHFSCLPLQTIWFSIQHVHYLFATLASSNMTRYNLVEIYPISLVNFQTPLIGNENNFVMQAVQGAKK